MQSRPILPSEYYRNRRPGVSQFIEKGEHRVLDVGCGSGYFGAYLKEMKKASVVVGIEINPQAAAEAATNLDSVLCADLNRVSVPDLLEQTEDRFFDYIVCADVLEHLNDPWTHISDLRELLKPNGQMIVSIPNVRHWTVLIPLFLKGRWDYVDAGIMDRTHVRFFTKSTGGELMAGAGLNVTICHPLIGGKWKYVDKLSAKLLREFVAVQWVFVGTKRQ